MTFYLRILSSCFLPCSMWAADLALPTVFSDHMVFQQGQSIPIWGWADAGEVITVTMGDQTVRTTATATGTWRVELDKMTASTKALQLRIAGQDRVVTCDDVLVGEVWFCSGQSNMAFTLAHANQAELEIANADYPQIRMFHTIMQSRIRPPETWDAGSWQPCIPQHAPQFSAVAYFFARQLQEKLQVPIGVVVSAIGGTSATCWVSQDSLSSDPALKKLREDFEQRASDYPPALNTQRWETPEFVDAAWKTMTLPSAWEKSGQGLEKLDGAVWFRREITIPEAWAGKTCTFHLGPVDDGDTVYVNGHRIGNMNVDTPRVWTLHRHYPMPAAIVSAGKTIIAIRVTDQLGDGGIIGTPEEMHITLDGDPNGNLPLAGPWKYAIEEAWPPQQIPTTLYTGMVAPWTHLPIAGVVWYQGESDANNPQMYQHLLPALISGWRAAWKQPALPFQIVQLPNFGKPATEPDNSNWAGLRESQAIVASSTAHTGLTVTLGLGEDHDIHPKNKQDVGLRVAQLTLAEVYHHDGVYTGPVCARAELDGTTFRLQFAHVGGGLRATDSELHGFAIAGADNNFVWADARFDGDTVVVSSPKVTAPVALRYAWADSPHGNLMNTEGFPAAPFRCEGSSVIPAFKEVP